MDKVKKVILFTRGTMGDIFPFLHVGRRLKEKGCSITLMSNARYQVNAEREGFEFVALDDEEWFDYLNNREESARKLPVLLELYREIIPNSLEREVRLVESQINSADQVIILAHSNDYMAPLMVSEKCKVSLFLCVLAPAFVYSLFFFEAVLTSLSTEINAVRNKLALPKVNDWHSWMLGFKKAFAFWPDWFDRGSDNSIINLDAVGFPSVHNVDHEPLQHHVEQFLSCDKKCIVISHGTSQPFRDHYFKSAIEACSGSDHKLLVVTPFRQYLPANVDSFENILVTEYCPFHVLLPKVDLLIHHGGIGTLKEAMVSGIPQIIVGKGYDRPHNGKLVKSLDAGDWLSPNAFGSESLREKIDSVLYNNSIRHTCAQYKEQLIGHAVVTSFYDDLMGEFACQKLEDNRALFSAQ